MIKIVLNEAGVLPESIKYFSTPSDMAEKLLYYVTRCGHYICNRDYIFSSHTAHGRLSSRMTFLLFYIISGKLKMNYDGKVYCILENQVSIIDCRKSHEYYSTADLDFIWIHLDGANSRQFYEQIIESKGQVFSVLPESGIFQTILDVHNAYGDAFGLPEIEHSQRIYRMLCSLLLPQNYKNQKMMHTPIGKAIHYIETHLFSEISVQSVADFVNMSCSHFTRLFKNDTNYSPHEYIILKRIDRAKYLLSTTSLTIKEIAYQVGYNNEANFVYSFKRKVGFSPGSFRKS